MCKSKNKYYFIFAFFDFKILTALKGWVGHAPQGRGALHIYKPCVDTVRPPLFIAYRRALVFFFVRTFKIKFHFVPALFYII